MKQSQEQFTFTDIFKMLGMLWVLGSIILFSIFYLINFSAFDGNQIEQENIKHIDKCECNNQEIEKDVPVCIAVQQISISKVNTGKGRAEENQTSFITQANNSGVNPFPKLWIFIRNYCWNGKKTHCQTNQHLNQIIFHLVAAPDYRDIRRINKSSILTILENI